MTATLKSISEFIPVLDAMFQALIVATIQVDVLRVVVQCCVVVLYQRFRSNMLPPSLA